MNRCFLLFIDMIVITINDVIDENYYSDIFLKSFNLHGSPTGLIARISVLGIVRNQTIQQVQNKIDTAGTFKILVNDSGNRNGYYSLVSPPVVSSKTAEDGIEITFVGERPFVNNPT